VPPDGGVDAKNKGELDPAVVAAAVRSHLGELKGCFEQALRANPNLAGKIVLHWTIEPSGSVSAISLESSTIADAAMVSCIQAKVAAWRFQSPSGGSIEVSFPFVFQASADPAATTSMRETVLAPARKKKPRGLELPVRSRLVLGRDGELVAALTGVDQIHDGQTPHLEIALRRGHATGALRFDFSPAKYPALADVIAPSFFWVVDSALVQLGSKRVARVSLTGRTGEDLMVLQEIAILVDVDAETPKLLWLGLGDREENTFDTCLVYTHATFDLPRPGTLQRTSRSSKKVSRGPKDDVLDDYRRNCRAPPVRRDEFPLAGG
jgi:hypothetical protein